MNPESAIDLGREAIQVCMMIGGPILLVCLVVGLLIGLTQAITQVHDQSISTVPKILIVLLVVGIALPWFAETMIDFSTDAFGKPMLAVNDSSRRVAKPNQSSTTVDVVVTPAVDANYYPELNKTTVLNSSTPSPVATQNAPAQTPRVATVAGPFFQPVSYGDQPRTLTKRESATSATPFMLPSTTTTSQQESSVEPAESVVPATTPASPFSLPHYRFSRQPSENKEG